jgi:HEAT repeat protein
MGYMLIVRERMKNSLKSILYVIYLSVIVVCASFEGTLLAKDFDKNTIESFLLAGDIEALRDIGPAVLPVLASLYESSDVGQRLIIANMFYQLGWKSSEAKAVLMRDVHTQNRHLRIAVQYALGRLSDEDDVVKTLLSIMQHDDNPFFRDKAACALAYDQIHLTEKQKVQVYEGLIAALGDTKEQVRSIAILALQIHTGQTKGFTPQASAGVRAEKIQVWQAWLEEYKSQL